MSKQIPIKKLDGREKNKTALKSGMLGLTSGEQRYQNSRRLAALETIKRGPLNAASSNISDDSAIVEMIYIISLKNDFTIERH